MGIVLLVLSIVLATSACRQAELKPDPEALASAPPELRATIRATPFNYFRFVNHEWIARVCELFDADIPRQPTVQLHGDAHLEQYAVTKEAWGLDDFDDSTRGPALVDIVRFLGSIDLAARERGWSGERDRFVDRFFAGYRQGLSQPVATPSTPDIVRWMMSQNLGMSNEAFLASSEAMLSNMDETPLRGVIAAMREFAKVVQQERPDFAPDYFDVVRAGWLRIGIGSAASRKVLIRVRGPSDDPADDVLLEAKAVRTLDGLGCLEVPDLQPTIRIVAGSQQLGRLKHNILAAGPEVALPEMAVQGEHLRDWWVRSWESSYREIGLAQLRSPQDLSDIVYDSGVQLGAGTVHRLDGGVDEAVQRRSLASIAELEPRLRHAADQLVQELLRGWNSLRARE
jgi:hypothetical protein